MVALNSVSNRLTDKAVSAYKKYTARSSELLKESLLGGKKELFGGAYGAANDYISGIRLEAELID